MKKKYLGYLSVCLFILAALSIYITSISSKQDNVGLVAAAPDDEINNNLNNIQDEIDKASNAKDKLENEKKQMEKDLAEAENKKDNVIEYIESLDKNLTELSEKIEYNREAIEKIKNNILTLRKKERTAQNIKTSQYATMKKRIKYMYENGNTDYVKLIFQSDNLTELLNRAEYVSKVTEFDKNMLAEYQKTCEDIKQTKKERENELEQLNAVIKTLEYEKTTVNKLIEKKSAELEEYEDVIGKSSIEIKKYIKMISQKEKEIENILEQQRKEIKKQEAENLKPKKTKSPSKTSKPTKTSKPASTKKPKPTATTVPKPTKTNKPKPTVTKKPSVTKTPKPTATPKPTSAPASSDYCWPLSISGTITSYFGYREQPTEGASTYHNGIDVSVPTGTDILAVQSGTVVTAAYSSSAGNYISVYHGDGVYTYYMHCSSLNVSEGDSVSKGQKIALSGSTGISTGPHLHFGMYMNGNYVNPLDYISQ